MRDFAARWRRVFEIDAQGVMLHRPVERQSCTYSTRMCPPTLKGALPRLQSSQNARVGCFTDSASTPD